MIADESAADGPAVPVTTSDVPGAAPGKGKRGKKGKAPNPRMGRMVKAGDEGPAQFVGGATAAPPKSFDAAAVAEELGIFWKSGDGDNFWRRGKDGRWSRWTLNATVDAMRALPGRMINIKIRETEMLSEAKRVLLYVRENRCLDDVVPAIPGYGSKIWELVSGERVLVKNGPRLVAPEQVPWDHVKQVIEGRLDRRSVGGIDQSIYFHCWCKVAAEAIRSGEPGNWRAGHALILAGPAGCGKNRLQEQIITPLLGGYGRYADPAKFLFEGDEFNGDVFAAEHLMLSEIPVPSQRTVDRTSLAEKIKQVVANPGQRMRLMRTEPCTVSPFWRLTISVNDHPDKLRSLPLITGDFADKVLLLHCVAAPLPIITSNSIENQQLFRDTMAAELPGYLWWLLNEFEIPEELKVYEDKRPATRFGFREYHAACIKEGLFDDTPEAQLLSVIDSARFTLAQGEEWDGEGGWKRPNEAELWDIPGEREVLDHRGERMQAWWGRAETLQLLLTGEGGYRCNVATMAKKLFAHNRCSTLLGRLHADEVIGTTRVAQKATNAWKGWQIFPGQRLTPA